MNGMIAGNDPFPSTRASLAYFSSADAGWIGALELYQQFDLTQLVNAADRNWRQSEV